MDLVEKYKSYTSGFDQIEREIENSRLHGSSGKKYILAGISYYATNNNLRNYFKDYIYNMEAAFYLQDDRIIRSYLSRSNQIFNIVFPPIQSFDSFKLYVDNLEIFDNRNIKLENFLNIDKIKYLVNRPEKMRLLNPNFGSELLKYAYRCEYFTPNRREIVIYLNTKFDLNKFDYIDLFNNAYYEIKIEMFKLLIELQPDEYQKNKSRLQRMTKVNISRPEYETIHKILFQN